MSRMKVVIAGFGIAAMTVLFLEILNGGSQRAASEAAQEHHTQASTSPATPSQVAQTSVKKIMMPAVAGLFYPGDPTALSSTIEGLLEKAAPPPVRNLKALVCPHAGYRYSGLTAAHGYKLLIGSGFETAIVLAPSHYARFNGVALSDADAWQTPLGVVPMSPSTRALAKITPFAFNPPCQVHRPDWWRQSSLNAPPAGEDTPHTWEHSDEVQIPFLQKTLKNFSVVSAIFGEVDPADAALALVNRLDDKTLLIASSDLSHYHPYDQANALDKETVQAILDLDVERMMAHGEACGKKPILTLMHIAKMKGWRTQLLDRRNSGDTAGDQDSVVGYSSIAFYDPAVTGPGAGDVPTNQNDPDGGAESKSERNGTSDGVPEEDGASDEMPGTDRAVEGGPAKDKGSVDIQGKEGAPGDPQGGNNSANSVSEKTAAAGAALEKQASGDGHAGKNTGEYSAKERKQLLTLARETLDSVVRKGALPDIDATSFSDHLQKKRGCFVTLTRHGQLRGCIGHIFAQEPLYLAVQHNARSAALEDPRFPPVSPQELDTVHIEISILTEPKPLEFGSPEELLDKLQPLKDGVVLNMGWSRATYLPQVWEQLPDKESFLSHLSQKAGAAPNAWRKPGTEVLIYHAEAFEESEEDSN